jgi:hypothetical protein
MPSLYSRIQILEVKSTGEDYYDVILRCEGEGHTAGSKTTDPAGTIPRRTLKIRNALAFYFLEDKPLANHPAFEREEIATWAAANPKLFMDAYSMVRPFIQDKITELGAPFAPGPR